MGKKQVFLGAFILAALISVPFARAELVYETEVQPAARVQDRESFRTVVGAAQRFPAHPAPAEPTQQVVSVAPAVPPTAPVAAAPVPQTVAVAPVQPVVMAPAAVAEPAAIPAQTAAPVAAAEPELQGLSKSELMRRERVREELRNEDVIQERLEELRLRDERRRSEQLLGVSGLTKAPAGVAAPEAVAPAPMQEQMVAAPVTERPGQPAPVMAAPLPVAPISAPTVAAPVAQPMTSAPAEGGGYGRSMTTVSMDAGEHADKTVIRLSPRAGVSSMGGSDGLLKVSGRYTLGVGLSIEASENMTFEMGYSFSEYGVSLDAGSGFAWASPTGNYETRALKQNVVDAGLKFYLLGAEAKLRPFVGGGAGWQKSFLNYDDRYRGYFGQMNGTAIQDYSASSFLGYLSGGFDVRISKMVIIGTQFRYYSVLSSSSDQQVPYSSMWGFQQWGGGYGAGSVFADVGHEQAGQQLQRSSFYSILGNVTFTF